MMQKNESDPNPQATRLDKIIKKIARIFEWIAEGQTAGTLCKG